MEKTITKAIPVVGGLVSGGLTYVTFRPMGHRLADALFRNLNGDFNDQLELTAEFAANASWIWSPHGDAVQTGHEPLVCSEFGVWGLPDPKLLRGEDGKDRILSEKECLYTV